jgi:hypothetical protein
MTEQLEDDFWAAARAQAAAARGQHADPGACGTCRDRTAAGGQVKHDECAQRATLLPAPDHPSWELITGMTEEEVWALPARFHVPVFMESSTPKAWVCAVCWGDGWSTVWPCKTATDQGLRVFTADDYAQTRAQRNAADLAAYRAQQLGDLNGHVSASCDNPVHPPWLRAKDDTRDCPWCVIDVQAASLTMRRQELATAEARVAELERERKKYVGAEPTIAEEMAYLSACLDAVRDLCDKTEQQATRWEQPLPAPDWVVEVRKAAEGLGERKTYPLALPWAQLMDDDDLHDFLGDLIDALNSERPTMSDVLAEVEKTCASHRAIAEAQHAHNTADGPEAGETP